MDFLRLPARPLCDHFALVQLVSYNVGAIFLIRLGYSMQRRQAKAYCMNRWKIMCCYRHRSHGSVFMEPSSETKICTEGLRLGFFLFFDSLFCKYAICMQILSSGMKIIAQISLKIPSTEQISDVGGRQFLPTSDNCSNDSIRIQNFSLGRKVHSSRNYKLIYGWNASCIHFISVLKIFQAGGNPC